MEEFKYSNTFTVAANPTAKEVIIVFGQEGIVPTFEPDKQPPIDRISLARIVMTSANAKRLIDVLNTCIQPTEQPPTA